MDSERWQQVESLYHAVLECEESQRAAFLTRACGGDEALRREVESLISCGKRAERFIERSALEVIAPALAEEERGHGPTANERLARKMIGQRISQYRIVEQLGTGGMGEVYRAVRADDQYQKQVAIKLVRAGADSAFVINRFKNERQILANLDHPNIARLLDGGATDEGVPYFVMELVEGQPIDKYCDSHKLGILPRLKLIVQVCSAVAYAHQHQIIHRDIKPANILVTAEGVPKLLDFGIAKILDAGLVAGAAEKTQTQFRAFTPEYASPEQIKGAPISTASDVYSLGVLLYELLTGHRPYRFRTHTPAEIERAICEAEPLKPSTVVTRAEEQTLADGTTTAITPEEISQARNANPQQIRSSLVGDLDAIVMMALRKEPNRRYGSVEDLAGDIRRHLEGLPITARPSTIAYRGVKFIRRHRELAMGALLFLALLGGLAIVRRQDLSKHVSEPLRDVVRRQITASVPGEQVNAAAISRDGKYLAYSNVAWKVYLLQIDSGEIRQLPFTDVGPLDWFPDGDHLLITGPGEHSGVWKMSIRDGTLRKLSDSTSFARISPDGSQIAYTKASPAHEIWLMGENGEAAQRIATFDALDSIDSFAWSPGGQRLVYIRKRGDYWKHEVVMETCDLQGGQRTLILSEPRLWGPNGISDVFWLRDGRILYRLPEWGVSSDSNIWAVAVDPGNGRPLGPPTRVTNGAGDASGFTASADGKRFAYISARSSDAVYLGNLELGAKAFNPRRLTLDEWNSLPHDWTRDSEAVLLSSIRSGRPIILRRRIDQQTSEILLSGADSYTLPIFSPSGDRLLYTMVTADHHDPPRLMSMPVDGGTPKVLLAGNYHYRCGSLPSAGCVLSETEGQQLVFSMLDPVEGKGEEIQRVEAPANSYWALSPDGNKIAIADASAQIRILTLADRSVTTLALRRSEWDQIQSVCWAADGGHLFATAWGDKVAILLIDLRGTLQVLAEAPTGEEWLWYPVASPDGHYLAYMKRIFESNLMMLEF